MDYASNSIIVCDDTSPAPPQHSPDASVNYRKRLRSSSIRPQLLKSNYDSPLNHFKRSLKAPPKDVDTAETFTPPAKRRKSKGKKPSMRETAARQVFNMEESVLIIENPSDEEPPPRTAVVGQEENDVVEIPLESPKPSTKRVPLKKVPKRRLSSRCKKNAGKLLKEKQQKASKLKKTSPKVSTRRSSAVGTRSSIVNDENCSGQIMDAGSNVASAQDSEIEVVWSSGPTPTPTVPRSRPKEALQQPFIIDTAPTTANLVKQAFQRNNVPPRHGSRSDDRRNNNKKRPSGKPREIVVDGCNVAMSHSRNKSFSEKGIKLVVDYFTSRGHTVKVFLPQSFRARSRNLIERLHVEGIVVFTPSRCIGGRKIASYDDRFILEYATQCDGIVVSLDQYRDLWQEKPQWRNTIENRLLAPTFVGDYLMFPEDPLGRSGPSLEQFLRH